VSLRASDEADNIGPLGASVLFRIGPPDQASPEAVTGLRVSGPDDEGKIAFQWDPSSAADLAGYNIYGRRSGAQRTLVNSTLIPAGVTSVTFPSDGEEFYVTALDTSGNESPPSAIVGLVTGGPATGSLILAGPFPHPVRDACRFEIHTPRSFSPARVTLVLRDVQGRMIREIYSGIVGPSETVSVRWDRRDDAGRIAAPGFYVAALRGGEARVLRKVFLSP
jgi:hypothetical protein